MKECCKILGTRNWEDGETENIQLYSLILLFIWLDFFQHGINMCWYFQVLLVYSYKSNEVSTYAKY